MSLSNALGVQFGVDGEKKAKRGRFHCLVAQRLAGKTGAAHMSLREQETPQTAAAVPAFFRFLMPEHLQVCRPMCSSGLSTTWTVKEARTAAVFTSNPLCTLKACSSWLMTTVMMRLLTR